MDRAGEVWRDAFGSFVIVKSEPADTDASFLRKWKHRILCLEGLDEGLIKSLEEDIFDPLERGNLGLRRVT